MTQSEYYYKKAKQALQSNVDLDTDRQVALVRDILFQFLQDLPEALRYDIFNYYYEKFLDDVSPDKTIYQLAQNPTRIIDFFRGEPHAPDLDFTEEEWSFIRDGINQSAEDMDIEQLNRLMAILVEKKRY